MLEFSLALIYSYWIYGYKYFFSVRPKRKRSFDDQEVVFRLSFPGLIIMDIRPRIKNILIKMPNVTINKGLKDCTICNFSIKKINYPYPGDFNDCFLTTYFITAPDKGMATSVGEYDKHLLVKTTRLYNQKSQIFIFVNFEVRNTERNLYNVYKACNAHFIKVFNISTTIDKGIIFILRNAIYYEFIMVNKHLINRVLTFDFTDTIFVEDPFGVIKNNSLYLTIENYFMKGYGSEGYVGIINEKYSNWPCDIRKSKMINGGFMAGYYTYVEQYLSIFLNYFTRNESYAEDQFYFNYMYYCRKITEFKVILLDHRDGFIHYCYHKERYKTFPPKETYHVSYFHQWNRIDCHKEYTNLTKSCGLLSKTFP